MDTYLIVHTPLQTLPLQASPRCSIGYFGANNRCNLDKGLTKIFPPTRSLGILCYKTAASPLMPHPDFAQIGGLQQIPADGSRQHPHQLPDGRYRGSGQTNEKRCICFTRNSMAQSTKRQQAHLYDAHNRTAHYPRLSQKKESKKTNGHHKGSVGSWHMDTNRKIQRQQCSMAGGTKKKVVQFMERIPYTKPCDGGEEAMKVRPLSPGVQRMDYDIEKIIEAQKPESIWQTLWILVVDHGESLGDHNELLHGASSQLCDQCPLDHQRLRIKGPGIKMTGKTPAVSWVDLRPTDYVGATLPQVLMDILIPLLKGEVSRRSVALSEGGCPTTRRMRCRIAPPWPLQERLWCSSRPIPPKPDGGSMPRHWWRSTAKHAHLSTRTKGCLNNRTTLERYTTQSFYQKWNLLLDPNGRRAQRTGYIFAPEK